ncbi:AbgT family transporter [Caldibacillus lycopersici]|uniref:AbgT family transporter n=1 Tax=Perspicuibacillus lycopersici TaxID=1325689 RepID=A0AAE3LLX2_9BACI|nr:Na+/H+ antiporter NhaC family protein [Perspicuibacillus lycopersici]MCU9612371.1 AbgT family transporter [Perspicuibacillus lycopersici]
MSKQKNIVKKKGFRPDAYVILFCVLIFAAILTYIIPSGSFERDTMDNGVSIIVPNSYERIDQHPTHFFDIFKAIPAGLIDASSMIFLVIIIGGTFAVIESTGALDSLIMKTINKTKNREWLLITIVVALLSFLGGLGIVSISVIAFIPIGISLAKAMKMDAMVGVAIMYLGAYSGFAVGFMDPIRTGFAQSIAQLPRFSGIGFRLIVYVLIVLVTIIYIIWYANKVKKNPQSGILGDNPFPKLEETDGAEISPELTTSQKLVLGVLLLGIGIYVYGAFAYKWSTNELTAIFIMIAIGTAIVNRMNANEFVDSFINGCKKIFYGAAIIGLASAIVIVLQNGLIIDTIVQGIYTLIKSFSNVSGAVVMLIVNALFNFVISSGTAHAAIIMPILTPLADLMDIPRQVAVQSYTLGDGFTNIINPLSGTLMAILAISGISWTKWLKFAGPLMLIWFVIGIISMMIAVLMNWGPM